MLCNDLKLYMSFIILYDDVPANSGHDTLGLPESLERVLSSPLDVRLTSFVLYMIPTPHAYTASLLFVTFSSSHEEDTARSQTQYERGRVLRRHLASSPKEGLAPIPGVLSLRVTPAPPSPRPGLDAYPRMENAHGRLDLLLMRL